MRNRPLVPLVLLVLLVLLAACSEPKPEQKPLTQRERDSILGASSIPGARGVQKALKAQDSLNARTKRADSIGGGDTLR